MVASNLGRGIPQLPRPSKKLRGPETGDETILDIV